MTQVIAELSNEDEIRRYHLKRLYELSLKSLGEIPELRDPEQEWLDRRMCGSARSWKVWIAK